MTQFFFLSSCRQFFLFCPSPLFTNPRLFSRQPVRAGSRMGKQCKNSALLGWAGIQVLAKPNKVTNGAKRRSNARLVALRTRANGGERSEIRLGGSGITRVERTRGIGASFDSKRASELCHRAPTSFSLAPSCSSGKALGGGKGGRDEGYAAPNPARARRGAVRRDRRSRYVPVYDPIAR